MDKQRLKTIVFIGFLLLSLVLLFGYLFSPTTVLLILFLIALVATFVFGYLVASDSKNDPLVLILDMHKEKEEYLMQKSNIQRQYLKRLISEKQFKSQINAIDKSILQIDYKLQYMGSEIANKELDLKRNIEFVQKKYFKQEIPEDLYNEIQSDLSKQLAQLNCKTLAK
jgi:hypothetical protein